MPQTLLFGVGLNQGEQIFVATGEGKVVKGDLVDGEHRRGGAKLGAHVSDGGTVCQWHLGHTCPVELNKLSHHTVLTQLLRDGENDVGGSDTGGNRAGEFEAHHSGNQHRDGLAQHGGFSFDTSNAPAEHTESVDHGGVRVSSHTGVGEGLQNSIHLTGVDHFGEVLNVHLVHDARSGGNDLEVIEGGLAPTQELVALSVAFVFDFYVALKRVFLAKQIRNDRVVNHELGRRQGVHFLRVPTEVDDGLAHGG